MTDKQIELNRAAAKELINNNNYIAFSIKDGNTVLIANCSDAHYIMLMHHIFNDHPNVFNAIEEDWNKALKSAKSILKEEQHDR